VATQAQAARDSVSAVSLDEEAVNLITYQQAYQANMKVISTAKELFDSMLAAF
jgi:Flagellar hook-associated protein